MADQELFNALAEEEALRDLLSDPRCRRQLVDLLKPERKRAWLARPIGWMTLAGSVAGLVVITSMVVQVSRRTAPAPPPVQVAQQRVEAPPAEVAPAPKAKKEAAAEQPAVMSYMRADKPAVAERRAVRFEMDAALAARPGLRYSILKDGAEAAPGAVFQPGDSLQLRVEADQSGFVSLLRQERVLFPKGGEPNRLEPGKPLVIPLPRVVQPGEEKLTLVLSREEVSTIEVTLRYR